LARLACSPSSFGLAQKRAALTLLAVNKLFALLTLFLRACPDCHYFIGCDVVTNMIRSNGLALLSLTAVLILSTRPAAIMKVKASALNATTVFDAIPKLIPRGADLAFDSDNNAELST
jgi:hypothetical protein